MLLTLPNSTKGSTNYLKSLIQLFRSNFFAILAVIWLQPVAAQSYASPSPHFSWSGKLNAEIKGKSLETWEGTVESYDNQDIVGRGNQFTVDNPNANGHLAWGGLYSFALVVKLNDSKMVKCQDTIHNHSRKFSILTTKLNGILMKDQCISVSGAFDRAGNFIARKIVNLDTNHIASDW